MMATITTKYSVGDLVWHSGMTTERKQHPCPDCLGSQKWKAVSPAGKEYEFQCPRCSARHMSNRDLSLDYTQFVGTVNTLTIGSVRVDTHDDRRPVSYMCRETGVGSGSIYYEHDLHASHEDASRHADEKAAAANLQTDWIVKQYDASLALCDYELKDAAVAAAERERIAANVRLGMLRDDIREAVDLDDLSNLKAALEREAAE